MLSHVVFLRALLVHVDRLQALVGEQWPDLQTRLETLLNDLLSERNERALPARVNRIYRCFEGTPAEPLVRALFQQAAEHARQMIAPQDALEKQITELQQAVEGSTRERNVRDWAKTQIDLGNAYSLRICGSREENLAQAIEHYNQALEVYTREAYPEDWAMIQNNLGNAYRNRITGERAENIERAIHHFEQALEVRTREAYPEQWAMTQNNLASAYRDRIRGERAENLEQAIAHCEQALQVCTRESFPEQWAAIQRNLQRTREDSERRYQEEQRPREEFERLYQEQQRMREDCERRYQEEQRAREDVQDRRLTASQEELIAAARQLSQSVKELSGPMPPVPPPVTQTVTAHPNLLGDDYAYLNKPYRLTVKLSDQPQPRGASLSAPELEIPIEPGEVVKKIGVRLTADDFDLDPSESSQGWLRDMNFYPEAAASSAVTFTLRPQDRLEERYFAALRVQFLLNGQVLGNAFRRLEVLQSETAVKTPLSAFPPAPRYPLDERGEARVEPIPTPISYHPTAPDIHLTITISENEEGNKLLWEIASPYLEKKDFPEPPYYSRNLGAEEFVKEYLAPFGMPGEWPEDHMDLTGRLKAPSVPILYNNLLMLRHCAPDQFWQLYQLALERHRDQGGTSEDFAILFITSDTHIPWELMPTSEKVTGDKMPLLLGSAHRVGRWLLDVGSPIPEIELGLRGFVLSAPTYTENPLPQAQEEKKFIQDHYHAQILPDNATDFIDFLKTGKPTNGTGIFHFAGHGDCCTDKMRRNWLVLTNREALFDINSASSDLGNRLGKLRPILAFFNACNVGRAAPGPLGSNGGWGRALLSQQYKSYIGPLWSVFDQHARDICQTFYTLALDEGLPLGEVMRRIRSRFSEDNQLFTYLAYLYLGHPLAKINYAPFEGDDLWQARH